MLKWLGFLQITEEALSKYEKTDIKMSTASVPANKNVQAIMLKSMVPDLGWFNRDWTKFEDWWRGVRLDLKSNRIIETDDRITVILAHLKRGIVGIYTQKKLKELDKELGIQDWDDFMKEIKTTFSNKTKTVDTKWRIESFKQKKWNTADFMIKFDTLAMKADMDKLHTILLLKKNIRQNVIKTILGYLPIAALETLKEWKMVITSVRQEYKFTEGQNDYKTSTGVTYGEWGQLMDIEKSNKNFKDGKPKCFNYNKYRHIAKECQSKKKE